MKKKKLIGLLVGCAIIIIGGFSFYYYQKENKFSNYMDNVNKLIVEGNYKEASLVLNEAKAIKNSDIVVQTEQTIKLDEQQSKVLEHGLQLAKGKKYKEAIDILEQINSGAIHIKEKANKEIDSLKSTLINQYIKNATNYINNNDFTNANKEINKIAALSVNDSNIKQLKNKIDTKKEELIKEYSNEVISSIDKNNFSDAKNSISKLNSLGADSNTVKDLEKKLKDKTKSEKYFNTKYIGISDNQTNGTQYFAAVPSKPLITRYYNPNLLNEKTFIKFYHENIKPKLYQGYCYTLRSIKDKNYGITFVCEPNENHEFNMGKLGPDGLIDIYSNQAYYCGIHGDKVVYYSLQTHNQVDPLINRN